MRCEGVVRTYRNQRSEVRALRGVAAQFVGGALNALIGPSGSGKSTLLRLLAALDHPDAGTIEAKGHILSSLGARGRRRFRRGSVWFVFQQPSDNFYPRISIAEQFPTTARRGWQILEELGIAERIEHAPEALSGGEQQRAAFAQAAGAGADLVLADEPTAELDSDSAAAVIAVMQALVRRGATVIAATHDPEIVAASDHVVALDHGLVIHAPPSATGATRKHAETPSSLVWRDWSRPPGTISGPRRTHRMATASSVEPALERTRSPEVVLAAQKLSKRYRRGDEWVHAVEEISLSLRAAEVVGIVGRSGSGKSTLLNLLAAWERPDRGTIKWFEPGSGNGAPVQAAPPWLIVAVVPQHLGLMDELTVRENIELPVRLAGHEDAENAHVDELLERLELRQLEMRYPSETSVGEQQRTALARALAVRPRMLLADEPTAHQDEKSAQDVFETIAWSSEGGTCCVVATHDASIEPYLDRVLLMRDGRLADEGGDSQSDRGD